MKIILYIIVVLLSIFTGIIIDTIIDTYRYIRREDITRFMLTLVVNVFVIIVDGVIILS